MAMVTTQARSKGIFASMGLGVGAKDRRAQRKQTTLFRLLTRIVWHPYECETDAPGDRKLGRARKKKTTRKTGNAKGR
jgi:hypothetical protein